MTGAALPLNRALIQRKIQRRLAQRREHAAGARTGEGASEEESPLQSERLTAVPALQRVLDGHGLIRAGDRGVAVRRLQQALLDAGFGGGLALTWVFDANTVAAVRAFQHAESIAEDGVVGPITVGRLDDRYARHQPHVGVARGFDPHHPDAGTHALDAADRRSVDQA